MPSRSKCFTSTFELKFLVSVDSSFRLCLPSMGPQLNAAAFDPEFSTVLYATVKKAVSYLVRMRAPQPILLEVISA